jgi:hypothetical protein
VDYFVTAITNGEITSGVAFDKYHARGPTAVSTDEIVATLGDGFGVGRSGR